MTKNTVCESSNATEQQNRGLCRNEQNDMRCSTEIEREASLVASTVISVVRDRSISSAYGHFLSILDSSPNSKVLPPLDCFFSEKVSERLEMDLTKHFGKGALNMPLYSGEGDLFGQLSKLLIVCNETLSKQNPSIIECANSKIASLGYPFEVPDNDYVKHLRNAVLHGHFEVILNRDNPFETIIHFWDILPNSDEITGDYRFTVEALNAVIDILIDDVCLSYLREIGWELR